MKSITGKESMSDTGYFDTFHVAPRYPFGYGLSYTEFEMHLAGMRLEKSTVEISVDVKNKGEAYSGKRSSTDLCKLSG